MVSARLRSAAPWIALFALAALPGEAGRGLLAAAGGTLFEAAPFVIVADLLPARLGRFAMLAGCGCSRAALPGALAPVAIALCWVAFGPAIALGRAFLAVALSSGLRAMRPAGPRHSSASAPRDPFAELATIAACSGGAYAVLALCPWVPITGPCALGFGVALGLLAPCATAGIALASATTAHAPLAAAAILATTGVVPRVGRARGNRQPARRAGRETRFAALALAVALASIAVRGPAGLVHPRLLPLDALGALAAAVYAFRATRRTRPGRAAIVTATMFAALVLGSPAPHDAASETTLAAGFAGEPARFTGVAHAGSPGERTRLVRFAITCCRIDARAIALPLDRNIPVRDGTWISARGVLQAHAGSLVLRADAWHAVEEPADPFVYR